MPPTEIERRVRFEDGDLDPVRMMIRSETGFLEPGTRIEVEVGARWKQGQGNRVGGVWVPCVVVTDSPKELVLKLLS